MAYITATEIQSEFRNTDFDTDTDITTVEVTQFITEYEAYIDARISGVYSIPVDAGYTSAINVLKIISKYFVVAKVKTILSQDSTAQDDKERYLSGRYVKSAEAMLDKIVNNEMPLPEVPRVGGTPSSHNSDNNLETTFKRNTDQW